MTRRMVTILLAWLLGTSPAFAGSLFAPPTGGVESVTGTPPIASSGGKTPVISLNDTAVTPGNYVCTNLTVDAQGRLTSAASGTCGAVSSVSNADGTLTVSPTTGAVVASLNLGQANVWTAIQRFDAGLDVRYSSTLFDRFSVDSTGALLVKATEKAPPAVTASLAGAGAGNIDNGTHSYKITWVTAGGETDAGAVSNVVTVTDKTVNGQVTVPRPTGYSSFVTGWHVYRTVAGDAGTWKKVTTAGAVAIATSSYTDNIADGSLGTDVPSVNMAIDARLTVANGGLVTLLGGGNLFRLDGPSGNHNTMSFARSGSDKAVIGIAAGTDSIITGSTTNDLAIRGNTQKILLSTDGGSTPHVVLDTSGNVGIGTTDLDGTPAIGRVTIKGSTNDGSTNILVGRDSDEANVFVVDTNGVITGVATNITGLPLSTGVTGDLPYANLTAATAASKLLGRGSAAGAGDWQEVTLGTGLSMSGTTLNATAGTSPSSNAVTTSESTASGTYTDLTTAGPSLTVDAGTTGKILVLWMATCTSTSSGVRGYASPVLSGANTSAADDSRASILPCGSSVSAAAIGSMLYTGLASGNTTVKLQYRADGVSTSFSNRWLMVWVF